MPTPTRAGYTFGGWYDGDNATGNQITDVTIVTTTSNQTLYAKWNAAVPIIGTQPVDKNVNPEGSADLSISASGGATGTSYSAITSTVGITYYYCIVTNTDSGANGNQTATASSNVAKVVVNAPPPPYETPSWYSVTGVSLDKTTLNLSVGEAPSSLTASVQPNYASYPAVTWSSSDPTVASVNGGVVTPLTPGQTTITVTSSDGGKTASCIVIVTPSMGESGQWDERQADQSAAQDKTWRVKFSKAVDPESINRQNIMVLDSNNEPVEIEVKADVENDKIILVTPKDSYKAGEHYRLYLGADFDSSTGKSLSKGILYRFIVE